METSPILESQSTRQQRKLRQKILEKYGAICVRCGFSDARALHIDHVHSNGSSELRQGYGGGLSYYYRVLKDDTGRYQILCANCNAIKRHTDKEARGMLQHKRTAGTPRAGGSEMDGQLGLTELKERAVILGYTKIQRQLKGAHVVLLAAWNGFSSEADNAYNHVSVWYALDGDKVTVYKAGKPEAYYALF
jgi:Recombination endonuclease VII